MYNFEMKLETSCRLRKALTDFHHLETANLTIAVVGEENKSVN